MARGEGRQRICETAVCLFNEQGYDAVSLRTIASEAGTTIGNLTYHFAHKEDLLEAILADLHQGFSAQLDRSLFGGELVGRLVDLIIENERNHERYPFYFENLAQLMAEFPSLRHENDTFARDIYEYYAWAFGELAKVGWLDSDVRAGDAQSLAYTMVAMQAGWVQASSPYKNELLPSLPLSKALAILLRLHVSQEHLDEYDTIWCKRGIEL